MISLDIGGRKVGMSPAPQPERLRLKKLFSDHIRATKRLANALKAAPNLPPDLFDRRASEELLAVIQGTDFFDVPSRAAAASAYLGRVEPCVAGIFRAAVRRAREDLRSTDPARVLDALSWVESMVGWTRKQLQKGPLADRPKVEQRSAAEPWEAAQLD